MVSGIGGQRAGEAELPGRRGGSARLHSLTMPGTYTIELAADAATSAALRPRGGARPRWRAADQRAQLRRERARRPEYIPSALRSAPGPSERRACHDLRRRRRSTPKGGFKGELTPSLGRRSTPAGGWWDAGDYLKFVQTTSYTVALQLAGVRDFPRRMGAAAGLSDFTNEARFGVEWLLQMWNDRTRRSTTRWDRPGKASRSATTTSGVCRRPTTPTAARPRVTVHPPTARVPRRSARRTRQPQPRRPRRGRVRALLPGVRAHACRTRRALSAGRRAHLRTAEHRPQGKLLTNDPVRLLPGDRMARRPQLGATELRSRCAPRPARRAAARRSRLLPAKRRRSGRAPTSPAAAEGTPEPL